MFLDTSGLSCCLDRREHDHVSAVELMEIADWRVTHNLVLTELIALANKRGLNRKRVLQFTTDLQDSPATDVVFVNEEIHDWAMQHLGERLDKEWSLCDAVSFLLMRESRIQDALTTDHHFEQAGFRRLLRP